jgi:hypothetical protein
MCIYVVIKRSQVRSDAVVKCGCAECAEMFSSVSVFDAHRVGQFRKHNRRCLTHEEMVEKGFILVNGYWTTQPMSDEEKARVRNV